MTELKLLGDICDFTYGKALRADHRSSGRVPVFGSNGIVGWHNQPITAGSTIIIGRKGSIGKVAWSDVSCYPIDTTYFIDRTKVECDLRWLYYALRALDLSNLDRSTAVPGLNREDAYEKSVRFPSVPEQQKLAKLMDSADRGMLLRSYGCELSDALLEEVFLETVCMESYPLKQVTDLLQDRRDAIRTGPFGSQLLHSEFTDSGIAVLGIDNVVIIDSSGQSGALSLQRSSTFSNVTRYMPEMF